MARLILKVARHKKGKDAQEYFLQDERDFHTEYGKIPVAAIKKGGRYALGKEEFLILPATFSDGYARLERGPQRVLPKDLGLVIAETGIDGSSVVLDIGFGSGAVTAFLARLVKKVYAYDTVQKHLDLGLENLQKLETPKRYTVKKGDAYDAATITAKNCDLFFLDVPEPWRALATARKALKIGGWLVAYTPCITQANQLVDSLGADFHLVKTVELIEREWKVQGKAVRPKTKDFSHTAFLTFIRRVQ